MKTIDLDKAKKAFRELWAREGLGWQYTPAEGSDPEYWSKRCEIFQIHVTHYGDNIFDVAVLWGQDASEPYASERIKSDLDTMKACGEEVAREFVNAAILAWMGFELTPTRPEDEIRFKQIATSGHSVVGLDEEGRVFEKSGDGWALVSMAVTKLEKVEKDPNEPKFGADA